jgi:hypothetical protein
MQVAELEILPYTNLSEPHRQAVLNAIALHDYRDQRPAAAVESLLLREADMLDMLGMIGLLREFTWGPKDLKVSYERFLSRQENILGRLSLPRAQAIARERSSRMGLAISWLKEESFDFL